MTQQQEQSRDACGAAEIAALRIPGWPTTERGMRERLSRDRVAFREVRGRGGPGGKRREYLISGLPAAIRIALAQRLVSTSIGQADSSQPVAGSSGSEFPPFARADFCGGNTRPPAPAASFIREASRAGRVEGAKLNLAENITEQAGFNRRLAGLKTSATATGPGSRRIDAKLAVISAFERFHRATALPVGAARHEFAIRYNEGAIAVEPWVRELVPDLSAATLWRWQRQVKTAGVGALAGHYGNRRGDSLVDRQPELAEFVIAMVVQHPHATSAHVMQSVRARFNGHNSLEYPSPRALQRWLLKWKRDNKQTFTALRNPDAWKGSYMAAFGSKSDGIERVNQLWELDSTPGDVMLVDGRHAVIGVIDVASRRGKLLVSKTSKATAIATLLRHTLLDWGVPEEAMTDNGSDYTSHHIVRVFRGLGVEQTLCPPFQPWHKPHIERFFGTFSHDLVELLPSFIGHNVAERKAIEARASFAERLMKRAGTLEISLDAAEFQKFCDRWCDDIYAHRAHDALKGRTPFEISTSCRDTVKRITDERALDVLLAEAPTSNGLRTVQKKGIELDQAWFIAPELGTYIGTQVHVRFDPVDLGRIYVFDLEDGFVCVAECPERTGMDRQEVAFKARALQKALVQEERAALKANAKRLNTDQIVTEILAERAEAAGKLTRLPARVAPHQSAGLSAAAEAARSTRTRGPAPISDDERAAQAAIERDMAQGVSRKVVAIDDPEANYRRWLAVGERIQSGVAVSEHDRAWHVSYMNSDECRAMKRMWPDIVALEHSHAAAV